MEVNKYKVSYQIGSETYHEDGIWTLKQTPKRIIAEKIEESMTGIYRMHEVGEKIRVGKGTGNPMEEHWDGGYIIYFNQAGTPYYFELIKV
jgi:hypothetical protein